MAHYAFLDEDNIVTEVITGIDETETIVKWITANGVPSSVAALTTKGPYMTHDEALALMSTEAWTIDMPMV